MIRRVLNKAFTFALSSIRRDVHKLYDLILAETTTRLAERHANPMNRFGRKVFSQTDEEGITLEILGRIGLPSLA